MSLSIESKLHVSEVASDSLEMLTQIANLARMEAGKKGLSADSFASVNTLMAINATHNVDAINASRLESSLVLSREPALARITVLDQDGQQRIYYICRVTPVSGVNGLLTSYKAPAGRLASMPIGETLALPNGDSVQVTERLRLQPKELVDGWDSQNSILEMDDFGPVTIESLKALLYDAATPDTVKNFLAQALAEDAKADLIYEGVRRNLITQMGLRDQPILDQYQDEIFRLPLNQRMLILGPPGTGKTTTLIRRLGQKLDIAYLSDEEKRSIEIASQNTGASHSNSWLMFTPTELLKQYLKEAFAREGVPASDLCLKTWTDHARYLGRNVLSILKTPGSSGIFTLKITAETLSSDALNDPINWYLDFDQWQRSEHVKELLHSVKVLSEASTPSASVLGKRISAILESSVASTIPALFLALSAENSALQSFVTELKDFSDKKIDESLNLSMNRSSTFLDELAQFIDQLHISNEGDSDEGEEQEADEDDGTVPKTGRGVAIAAYRSAVRAQARSRATQRTLNKSSRNARIVDWLGEGALVQEDLERVGVQLMLLTAARRFVNPVKRYLESIPKRYRTFRRERQESKKWYQLKQFSATDLHAMELDILLLSSFRSANELLSRQNIVRRIDDPFWGMLRTYQDQSKNQILVDEATDFSPIQLACMGALAHPQLNSFFACGDFNQRLTQWGSRSVEDIKWIFPDIDIREINVTYRQSRQLNGLAVGILDVFSDVEKDGSLPRQIDGEGQMPVLLENASNYDDQIGWLANRIGEIESFLKMLPSTAVFVRTEAEVQPLADALNSALEDNNVRVIACPNGQVMGNDNDVRVFHIQHIKGLEFEAVFFVDIDKLASQYPELFGKYLYVGATRAATYLGVTCQEHLPSSIESLRSHFGSFWCR